MRKFLIAVLASVALIASFAVSVPAAQASYNHLATCKGTLRGIASDDDIHQLGVQTGATSFGGWGTYWHDVDGSVYVYGRFNYPGYTRNWLGHCWGGDYGPDAF